VAPRIRFFRGKHGRRIAYATDGSGPYLILPAWWVSHVERDLAEPSFRDFFTRLAERTTVVRYDRPGVGLSDRERPAAGELSDDLGDLESLVDELDAEKVALLGISSGGPLAVAYAARHPRRTSHLVLYGAYECGARLATDEVKAAMIALVRASWGLGSQTLADVFAAEMSSEQRRAFVAIQREAASADMAAMLLELTYRLDVSDDAADVRVPTLVLHRRNDRAIHFDRGRSLAALIPGATLQPLEGSSHLPWVGETGPLLDAVLAFVASARGGETADENAFVRQGEVWIVRFAGRASYLKHTRGMSDLGQLLSHPGQEIHASVLMDSVGASGADPILDDRARGEIKARLLALDEEVRDAEARGDGAALRAAEERAALISELRAATGLGGRRRVLADPAERARKAVSARIRESIDKLRGPLPELGRHLDETIVTGTFCSYTPAQPCRWRF
jgi:pimeloyl-ACP methyl ester carboxylesterase